MTRHVLIAALLVLPVPALAQATGPVLNHCQFSWSEPVVTDNDLLQFNIYLATVSGGPYTKVGSLTGVASGGGATYTPTTNYCVGQTDGQKFAVVKAQDTAGNESGASNEVPFVLNATAPPAASSLTVR